MRNSPLFHLDVHAFPHKAVVHPVLALEGPCFETLVERRIGYIPVQVLAQEGLGHFLRLFDGELCTLLALGHGMRDVGEVSVAVDANGEFLFFERLEPSHTPAPRVRVLGRERVRPRHIDVSQQVCKVVGTETARE